MILYFRQTVNDNEPSQHTHYYVMLYQDFESRAKRRGVGEYCPHARSFKWGYVYPDQVSALTIINDLQQLPLELRVCDADELERKLHMCGAFIEAGIYTEGDPGGLR